MLSPMMSICLSPGSAAGYLVDPQDGGAWHEHVVVPMAPGSTQRDPTPGGLGGAAQFSALSLVEARPTAMVSQERVAVVCATVS